MPASPLDDIDTQVPPHFSQRSSLVDINDNFKDAIETDDEDDASYKSIPLQRSPAMTDTVALRAMSQERVLRAEEAQLCQDIVHSLDEISTVVTDEHLSDKETNQYELIQAQQQKPDNHSFKRRNSKKNVHYSKIGRNSGKSQQNEDETNKKSTTFDVQPNVTITEEVVTTTVTTTTTEEVLYDDKSALKILSNQGRGLPFIDEHVTEEDTELMTKLKSVDDNEEEDIDQAIMEAAGVKDNGDKTVESIQVKQEH